MSNRIVRLPFILLLIGLLLGIGHSKDVYALSWKMPPDQFVTDFGTIDYDLAADPQGNAFTAFSDFGNLYVSRFSNTTGSYGPPVPISIGSFVSEVKVATDASGTALLVWHDDTLMQLLTAFYNGSTWVTPPPSPLDSFSLLFLTTLQVEMDGKGNGLAAWRRDGPTPPGDIIVSFFDSGTQSFGPQITLTPPGTGGIFPKIGYSSNGTAVAVWRDNVGNIVASNFNGTSWSALPQTIGINGINHQVGIDASGNALAVWVDVATSQIVSSYYNGVIWGAIQPVSTTSPAFNFFSFAMAPTGTAIATWTDGANGFYAEFLGASWTTETLFFNDVLFTAVAVDTVGNALIGFNAASGDMPGYSIYKPFGELPGTLDPVVPDDQLLSITLAALSDNQRGFLDGMANLQEGTNVSGTYTLLAPITSGTACTNKFVSQSDRVHIITWQPFIGQGLINYILRRNGDLIAAIPPTGPLVYEDHNRCKTLDAYTLTALTIFGESSPGVVVLE